MILLYEALKTSIAVTIAWAMGECIAWVIEKYVSDGMLRFKIYMVIFITCMLMLGKHWLSM